MTMPNPPKRYPLSFIRAWLRPSALLVIIAGLSFLGCSTGGMKRVTAKPSRAPAQSRLKYELALQHYEGGRTAEAITTIKEAISAHPKSTRQHLFLAQCYIELGKFVSAKEAAEKAKGCNPESADADYTLGVIAERTGDFDTALKHYRNARSRGRGSVDFVVAEAECLTAMGQSAQAIALISDHIENFDSDGTLEMLLAQIHVLDGDKETALREFGFALERSACDSKRLQGSRSCALLVQEYGELLASEEQYEQAIAILQPHIAANDGAPASVIVALGSAYLNTDRVDDAQRLFLLQSKRHPKNAMCWLLFARASIRAGDWVTARRTTDTLVRLVPDSSPAHLVRGFVYWKMNDQEEAIEALERSLAIEPEDALAHCLISQILENAGYGTASADAHHERAVEIDPQHACAKRNPTPRDWNAPVSPAPLPVLGSAALEARLP